VELVNNFIDGVHTDWSLSSLCLVLSINIDSVEIVEFGFVEVRQVPVDANVFKAQVVPIVIIGVVGHCVVMDVLASHEAASKLDELAAVNFVRSADSLTVSSWDPSAFDDQSSAIDLDRVALQADTSLHGDLTTFVTVKGVDDVVSSDSLSIDNFVLGDENFLRVVELTKDEVGAETVLNLPFFLGHTPPGEVHLLPGSAVSHSLGELVVGFGSSPRFLDGLTVVEVGESTGCEEGVKGAVTNKGLLIP